MARIRFTYGQPCGITPGSTSSASKGTVNRPQGRGLKAWASTSCVRSVNGSSVWSVCRLRQASLYRVGGRSGSSERAVCASAHVTQFSLPATPPFRYTEMMQRMRVRTAAVLVLWIALPVCTWSVALLARTATIAKRQVNTSRAFGPGACGPVDATYITIANETGGQPFFMSPSEVGASAHIMMESSRSDAALILWASGTAAAAARGFDIPVDASIKRLTVSATFDSTGGSLALLSPDWPDRARQGAGPGDAAELWTRDQHRCAAGRRLARKRGTVGPILVGGARTERSRSALSGVRATGRSTRP